MENRENHRQELGRRGEDLACRYLSRAGHTILERNWHSGHLEIDIISQDESGIHFVEVKTRQKSIQTPPQENVRKAKQRNIVKAARRYLSTQKQTEVWNHEYSFDIIAVSLDSGKEDIEWFPQAYIPIYL